jgi:branched-chain amino acid transport system ATP-binding protein
MSAEPLLIADDLTAGYLPGVNILNGCSLELFEGELVGIIGPNGAGKSTLVKAIFGLVNISAGAVRLRGEDITNMKAHSLVSRGIGYVPQTNNVFPSLTIEENLEMGTFLAPKTFAQRFDVVGEMFPKLVDRRDQRAGSLSGGERQMLAMGRALMMDPSVLLLDEPSAGLSPALQDEVFVRCHKINRAGVSIVMVEQNASRCLQICHRGYVLDQGANAYSGTGRELAHRPEGDRVVSRHVGQVSPGLTSLHCPRRRSTSTSVQKCERAPGCPGALCCVWLGLYQTLPLTLPMTWRAPSASNSRIRMEASEGSPASMNSRGPETPS